MEWTPVQAGDRLGPAGGNSERTCVLSPGISDKGDSILGPGFQIMSGAREVPTAGLNTPSASPIGSCLLSARTSGSQVGVDEPGPWDLITTRRRSRQRSWAYLPPTACACDRSDALAPTFLLCCSPVQLLPQSHLYCSLFLLSSNPKTRVTPCRPGDVDLGGSRPQRGAVSCHREYSPGDLDSGG